MMKKNSLFLVLLVLLAGCHFKNDDDGLMKISSQLKAEAEKKFGHHFDEERKELGLQPIPKDWEVTYNENYEIYFSKNENIDHVKGYVCKIVTYDKNLNIISEEDYYRSVKDIPVKVMEECEDNHFSFIYNFIEKEYSFNSNCCEECGVFLSEPWYSTKEGFLKKRDEVISGM